MTQTFRGGLAVLMLVLASQAAGAQEISDGAPKANSHKGEIAGAAIVGAAGGAAALIAAELGHGTAAQSVVAPRVEQPQPPKAATPLKAPEISTSGLPASMALLAGVVCILQGRKRAES